MLCLIISLKSLHSLIRMISEDQHSWFPLAVTAKNACLALMWMFLLFCRRLEASLARWVFYSASMTLSTSCPCGVFCKYCVFVISSQKGESVKKMREEVGPFLFLKYVSKQEDTCSHLPWHWLWLMHHMIRLWLIRYFHFCLCRVVPASTSQRGTVRRGS